MTNWNSLLSVNSDKKLLKAFAQGHVSGESYYDNYKYTDKGGQVRSLLRHNGVYNARKLARKALRRRGFSI
jgi:hypothetical protein